MTLENLFPFFEYTSILIALFFFKNYKKYLYYKYFLCYLVVVVTVETIASFISDNHYIFDIYVYFEFNIIALLYISILKNEKVKKFIISTMILFTIFHSLLYIEPDIRKYSTIVGAIIISVFAIFYFRELLFSDRITNYKKLLSFWLSVAFFIFFLTSIPFFTLFYSKLFSTKVLFPILYTLIIIYNGIFIYGLIICRKVKISS